MDLPFTVEQFLDVFRTYNQAIWPAQIMAYLLGLLAVAFSVWRTDLADRSIAGVLSLFWVWMGAVYHLSFFSAINPAAILFGALFIVQGLLFAIVGVVRPQLTFHLRRDAYGIAGGVLILYAMVVYPLLGSAFGHGYPFAPMLGVAPCPATIFTFGVLLWTVGRVPGWLLIIPGAWAVIGLSAALQLGIYEDLGLLVAGIVGVGMLLYRNRVAKHEQAEVKPVTS